MPRLLIALLAAAFVAPAAAQTVRFETSVGAFDMLLNPTNNSDLQPHVDNLLANVAAGVYHRAVVNRAATDFVLQLGGLQTESVKLNEIPEFGFAATNGFDPVVVDEANDGTVDFSTTGLTNTRGTVSLALSAGNANSGSAAFFVNLGDNSFLDNQDFIPFAEIADMATIDRIMNQQLVDLSSFLGQGDNPNYTDIPLAEDGDLLVIESAAVISGDNQVFVGPLRNAFGFDDVPVVAAADPADMASSTLLSDEELARFIEENGGPPESAGNLSTAAATSSSSASAIPEPSSLLLASLGLLAFCRRS